MKMIFHSPSSRRKKAELHMTVHWLDFLNQGVEKNSYVGYGIRSQCDYMTKIK